MQTLWRCVFDVAHVEVKTPAIEEKTPVARRFLVIPIVQIDRAGGGFSEKVVLHFGRPKLGINMRLLFAQQAAVFGFDSNDPIHWNQLTH